MGMGSIFRQRERGSSFCSPLPGCSEDPLHRRCPLHQRLRGMEGFALTPLLSATLDSCQPGSLAGRPGRSSLNEYDLKIFIESPALTS